MKWQLSIFFFGSIFKVPNVTNVGQNYICLCSGLKCPAATPCLPGFIWTASLGGNLKKETLSKYWHTSPTLSISISSAPEQRWFSPPPLDSSCNPTFRLPMKKKLLATTKKYWMSLGMARKSSKKKLGWFLCCSGDAAQSLLLFSEKICIMQLSCCIQVVQTCFNFLWTSFFLKACEEF